jgi:ATP-dependent DNA helicase RecG
LINDKINDKINNKINNKKGGKIMEKHESEIIEFKKTTSQLKEGIISLSAMLNKHGKGFLYFGIKDDGTPLGQDIGKKTTSNVSHEIRSNLKPLPYVNIECQKYNDKDIICITVRGDDTPYSAYGRYYTRIDDSDVLMDSKQLWKFFESKDKTYSKWEEETTDYGIEKIDEELLIQYIRDANEIGRLNYIYRNPIEALTKLSLIDGNGKINNAGYYLFGNDGPVTLKEVIYPTEERTKFTDLKQFKGNILQCIQEGMKYIQNNIYYNAEIIGTKRVQTPEIPLKAIREIVVNSFAHCRYQKGDYNEISISKSNVRIYNPGNILLDTDPLDFASGKIGSKIRNPLIATVLFKNSLIDAFGTGFDRTFKSCAENGVEYEYNNDEFGFTFIFKRKKDDKINDKIIDKKNNIDEAIIKYLIENCYLTIHELAISVSKSEPTIHRHLESLINKGTLERVGSRKNGFWKVNQT